MVEKMLRKLFRLLALFAFVSMVCFAVFLLHNQTSTFAFLTKHYYKANGNSTYSSLTEEVGRLVGEVKGKNLHGSEASVKSKAANESKVSIQDKAFMEKDAPKAVPETIRITVPANITIGPCPDTPPKLVGPLHVDFGKSRNWDEVREEVAPLLKDGGRFKPTECIAQKVAVIIPFRNRHEHLKHWLYYLHPILQRQQVDYGVYVINQFGDGVFNRAKLMNVGYFEALKEYDYDCFVFSDVDLVPIDDRNLYRCFSNPRHLAVAMDKFAFRLPYDKYFGGVASFSKEQFLKINGFPNTYWGWGGEDDDIYSRVVFHGMTVSRPDSMIGRYKMVRHNRDLHNEPNPKNPDKLHRTRWTMDKDGINSLKYTVKETVKDRIYTFITVDIQAPKS